MYVRTYTCSACLLVFHMGRGGRNVNMIRTYVHTVHVHVRLCNDCVEHYTGST